MHQSNNTICCIADNAQLYNTLSIISWSFLHVWFCLNDPGFNLDIMSEVIRFMTQQHRLTYSSHLSVSQYCRNLKPLIKTD